MPYDLVIVESPGKTSKISSFLGKDYKVAASVGHIYTLANSLKDNLGVDIDNNFTPDYQVDSKKTKVVANLKKLALDANNIYLATDPDREGEAIASHLAKVLDLDVSLNNRLEFHEITKKAVLGALENKRKIDQNLVDSQDARRIIDRIVGYKLSNLVQQKVHSASAGRVQSAVLKLIVDREEEINNFVETKKYSIKAVINHNNQIVTLDLLGDDNKIRYFETENDATNLIKELNQELILKSVEAKEVKKYAPLAFDNPSLLRDAYQQLNFNSKKTMQIAQSLYEAGLITYHRTDTTILSNNFVFPTLEYIEEKYGSKYKGFMRQPKGNAFTQGAHEAIRPSHIEDDLDTIKYPKSKSTYIKDNDIKALYKLIHNRALISLLAPALINETEIIFNSDNYRFLGVGKELIFDGFLKVAKTKEEYIKLPFNTNDIDKSFTVEEYNTHEIVSKPPSRYNEGSLISKMKEVGIGRPSTYATTIDTLKLRSYIEVYRGIIKPSDRGITTTNALSEYFPKIVDVNYTALMEQALDEIAHSKNQRISVLTEYYQSFIKDYDLALTNMPKVEKVVEEVGRDCPDCGSPLVYRYNKRTKEKFIACSNIKCKYVESLTPKKQVELTGENCPECNTPLVYRYNRKTNEKFIACPNFKCKYVKSLREKGKQVEVGENCPKCNSPLVTKFYKGKPFIACSGYPKCRYIKK